jgi:leucine-zipper of insertion element IS481
MKMHANARLSLKGRELLVARVEDAGWSPIAAAEAAGISDRTARKWIARYRAEGRDGLLDRSSAPRLVANRTDERRIEVIAALRRVRMTGAEIAECLDMALSTVSGILTQYRDGQARPAWSGVRSALRTSSPGRTDPHRRQEAGTDRPARTPRSGAPERRCSPPPPIRAWLGVRACLHRRRHPPGLRRGSLRRTSADGRRLPAPHRRALRQLRHHRRTGDHRQRQRLPIHRPRDRLPNSRDQSPPHPPLPPADQRQSRTLHPHHARRLGLRRDLPR